MAKAFGLWLKEYEGQSWRARYAAKKWRNSLRNDYLQPSQELPMGAIQAFKPAFAPSFIIQATLGHQKEEMRASLDHNIAGSSS